MTLHPTVTAFPGAGSAASGSGFTASLNDWLMEQALIDTPIEELLKGTVTRLIAAGVPLQRLFVGFMTLHPLYEGRSLVWEKENDEVVTNHYIKTRDDSPEFKSSPFYWMLTHGMTRMRRHLVGPGAVRDFKVLEEFREKGATDYLAEITPFNGGLAKGLTEDTNHIVTSFVTNRATGFTDEDLSILDGIQRSLTVAMKMRISKEETDTILATYLGSDAGGLVRNGNIRRGDGLKTHSVLWFCDLRQSTMLADSLPQQDFLELLNRYFECTAGAVLDHGGEVLRFVGDAVLAIFPIREDGMTEREACHAALTASREAEVRMSAYNVERAQQGKDPLDFGIGMHVGDVLYGNVGVPERLDFTVTGSAANEAARIEDMTKPLQRRILFSCAFARNVDIEMEHLGAVDLRGVDQEHHIFAPVYPAAERGDTGSAESSVAV